MGFALFEEITENWILQKRVNRSRYSSFGKELRERFTLVAVYKKGDESKLLFTYRANRSDRSLPKELKEQKSNLKKQAIRMKSKEQIPNST